MLLVFIWSKDPNLAMLTQEFFKFWEVTFYIPIYFYFFQNINADVEKERGMWDRGISKGFGLLEN